MEKNLYVYIIILSYVPFVICPVWNWIMNQGLYASLLIVSMIVIYFLINLKCYDEGHYT
jgi:hypothetical protein